jgi:hypothetical protein
MLARMALGGGQEAIVTDLDETMRQNVLEETADKLFGAESAPLFPGGTLDFPAISIYYAFLFMELRIKQREHCPVPTNGKAKNA